MVIPSVLDNISHILNETFVCPDDILEAIRNNEEAWEHFQNLSGPYKRIRIAYIDAARERPDEFSKRLNNFIKRTENGKLIKGYGGIDKYY